LLGFSDFRYRLADSLRFIEHQHASVTCKDTVSLCDNKFEGAQITVHTIVPPEPMTMKVLIIAARDPRDSQADGNRGPKSSGATNLRRGARDFANDVDTGKIKACQQQVVYGRIDGTAGSKDSRRPSAASLRRSCLLKKVAALRRRQVSGRKRQRSAETWQTSTTFMPHDSPSDIDGDQSAASPGRAHHAGRYIELAACKDSQAANDGNRHTSCYSAAAC
jgi:hypothetical protein